MRPITMLLRLLITAAMASVAPPAFAHGPDGHAKKKGTAPAAHAAALGEPGDPKAPARTIVVLMQDWMAFEPEQIEIRRGETIRFEVRNEGSQLHEMVLGTMAELAEHAAHMRQFPDMVHDDPNAVQVKPGETGVLLWHFTKAGVFDFACLVKGHFEAGMKGRIAVK